MLGKSKLTATVGLSGGVDSSVAAALLKQAGYNVIGVHMQRFEDQGQGCGSSKDRMDALRVAKKLGIPFRVVDFREQYQAQVIDRFVKDFEKGLTPNPDIWCNEVMKFGLFLDYATSELGVDYIATGHYARIEKNTSDSEEGYRLLAGVDTGKDQSYFLYRLNQHQLSKSLFPLGGMKKEEVRKFAREFDLPTAEKPDSVGICFIGDIDVRQFVRDRVKVEVGAVEDTKSNVIGTHDGVPLYTIGQRHGFTVTNYQGEPLYVVRKDIDRNVLVVGRGGESDVSEFNIVDLHFVFEGAEEIVFGENIKVRIRHLGELVGCTVTRVSYGDQLVGLECILDRPERGVAGGQHAVLYKDDVVLGGGVIEIVPIDPIL